MIAPRAQQASILSLNNRFNFVVNLFLTFGSKSTRLYHHHQKSCIGYLFLFVLVFVIAHCWLDVLYCYQAVVVDWWSVVGSSLGNLRTALEATIRKPFSTLLLLSSAFHPSMLCLLVWFVSYILNSLQGCKTCPTLILTFLGPSLHVISGKKDLALHCLIFLK